MVPFLYAAREHHAVRSPAEYRERHAQKISEKANTGSRARVHASPVPLAARIDAGSWIVDCECGAGNATDPEWGFACCFGCGAIHEGVTFPDDTVEIAALLVLRPRPRDRAWQPGEAVDTLRRENADLGVRS